MGSSARNKQGFSKKLQALLGQQRALLDPARLLAYECDGLTHFKVAPLAVALPISTDEVQAVVRLCHQYDLSITPRGAGTCLSGGAASEPGGIIVELSLMRRILRVDIENRFAVVQPGVVNLQLSKAVEEAGLAFAPDPSSQQVCTIGGNVAENSGGPHCLKAGPTSAHILGLKAVLADGQLLSLKRPEEGCGGLDLRGLFIGSEGTLGITTEITCRLVPRPRAVETLLASFRSLEHACLAVSAIIAGGIIPAALEVLDERTIAAVEQSVYQAGYPKDAAAVLLVELCGHPAEVAEDTRHVRLVLGEQGAIQIESAREPERRQRLWRGRKGAFGAMGRLAPDLYVQDTVVPRSKLAEVLPRICAICDELKLKLANVFHAGDGNLHPNISYDGRDPEETARVMTAGRRIIEVCLEAGGTLSGEHGIGLEKRDFMPLLFNQDDLLTMQRVRRAVDPAGCMNPGKLLPSSSSCAEIRALERKS